MDAGYPDDAGAVLLIEVEGTPDEVEELEAEVRPALRDAHSADVRTATDAADRERLWSGRKGALGALGSLAPNYYLVDGVVPRTQLALVLEKVEEVSKHYRFPIANVFHAGDGNLHPLHPVRRAPGGGVGARHRGGRRASQNMRRGRRCPERRARHRLGEESLHALGVQLTMTCRP